MLGKGGKAVWTSQVEESIRHQPGRVEGAMAGGSGHLSPPLGVKCCRSVSASSEKKGILKKRKKEKEGNKEAQKREKPGMAQEERLWLWGHGHGHEGSESCRCEGGLDCLPGRW